MSFVPAEGTVPRGQIGSDLDRFAVRGGVTDGDHAGQLLRCQPTRRGGDK